jgi:hypothetical protein
VAVAGNGPGGDMRLGQRRSQNPHVSIVGDVFAEAGSSDVPERRLMAAVLFDAVLQLARPGSKSAAEAIRWIRNRDDDNLPFSFTSVCEGLGLNAEYLARGLLTWNPGLLVDGRSLPSRRTLAPQRRRRVAAAAGMRRPRSAAGVR